VVLRFSGFEHVHPRVEELVTTHEEISESLLGAVTRACQDIGDDISDPNFKGATVCAFLFVSVLLSQEKALENFFLHLYWQPYPFGYCGLEVLNTCILVIMFLQRSATIRWDPSNTQIACDWVTTSRPFCMDEYLEKSLEKWRRALPRVACPAGPVDSCNYEVSNLRTQCILMSLSRILVSSAPLGHILVDDLISWCFGGARQYKRNFSQTREKPVIPTLHNSIYLLRRLR